MEERRDGDAGVVGKQEAVTADAASESERCRRCQGETTGLYK